MEAKTTNRWKWPWRPFVIFALLCAWIPGFLFAAFLGLAPALNIPADSWYRALVQGHGHAMLVGWGGGTILGVALHFLPRLRGAPLAAGRFVPGMFWAFATGTAARILGPVLIALAEHRDMTTTARVLHASVGFGILVQAIALFGIVIILAGTFRRGPPLAKKKGFRQIVPALSTAAVSAILAQAVWLWAAFDRVASGHSLLLLPGAPRYAAIEMLLFGGVPALSLGMSARLFPLTFRTHQASHPLIIASSAFLLLGVLTTAIHTVPFWPWAQSRGIDVIAGFAFAFGFVLAVPAVRVMHRRVRKTPAQQAYRLWQDPPGVGVVAAYAWGLVAAGLLLLHALTELTAGVGATIAFKDLARHAMGAGFMTMLIVAVGWTMLPGFGGGTPSGRRWIWLAIILLNLAVALRLTPGALGVLGQARLVSAIYTPAFATAGIAGWAAIGAFAWALWLSRKGAKTRR